MVGSVAQHVGDYRSVHFKTGNVDPVVDRFDLLIVGMPAISRASQIGGILCELDAALSGTLSHLRAGGLFDGRFGETLILSSPPSPVRSSSLLIIGMGDAGDLDAAKLGRLVTIAMRTAAQLDTRSIACLLSLPTVDISPTDIAHAARAMMIGGLEALNERQDRQASQDRHWIFDLRTPHVDIVVEQCKAVLSQWPL